MSLELFVTTVLEYRRFADQLPLEQQNPLGMAYADATYVAVQTRLMLLRKYTSKGRNNPVYIENVLAETKNSYPNIIEQIDNIKDEFDMLYLQAFEQILSDGTKLDLYETMEDIMYGLLLHADQNRIHQLSFSNRYMRFHYTRMYVENVEAVMMKLYELLINAGVTHIDEKNHAKAPIIHLANNDALQQDIRQSPYWSNMYGHDVADEDVRKVYRELTLEECQIFLYTIRFFDELKNDVVSIAKMREIVYEPKIDEWGDFSEAKLFYSQIPAMGINSKVRFSERG